MVGVPAPAGGALLEFPHGPFLSFITSISAAGFFSRHVTFRDVASADRSSAYCGGRRLHVSLTIIDSIRNNWTKNYTRKPITLSGTFDDLQRSST